MKDIPSPIRIRDWIRANAPTHTLAAIEAELTKVSQVADSIGAADPCTSVLVCEQLRQISGIKPPRSWRKEHHAAFYRLSLALQRYVLEREDDRDKAVARLKNADAAIALAAERLEKKKAEANAT
jgi:hypothetical protein